MLSCRELVELVTNYLEGALAAEEHLRFEEHLAVCPNCRTYVEQMRLTLRLLRRVPPETVSLHARMVLLEAFRDWKSGQASSRQHDT